MTDRPLLLLDVIYVPDDERLRQESFGDIESFASTLKDEGLLHPLVVRPISFEEFPGASSTHTHVLISGGRRYRALQLLAAQSLGAGSDPAGHAFVSIYNITDPLHALRLEFTENQARESFTWKEESEYVRRVHEACVTKHGVVWSKKMSAAYLGMGEQRFYAYLQLTEDPELFADPSVQAAEGFKAAKKKVKIAKETRRRKAAASAPRRVTLSSGAKTYSDYLSEAADTLHHGDCREWLPTLLDSTYDFAHWDPPYGGNQDGGHSTSHERIDDTPEYAKELHDVVLPELFRVLKPGAWLAIWFFPPFYSEIVDRLKTAGFWVNPYPCIWHKTDRKTDAHEITRYLTNAYETFLLAGKPLGPKELPILPSSDPQNVFAFPMIPRSDRRHIMHKPPKLISAIYRIISHSNELGIDPSFGSGSSIEAANATFRSMHGCELSETSYYAALDGIAKALEAQNKSGPQAIPLDPADFPAHITI